MKIELYTCKHGIALFKKGSAFGAWKDVARSYEDAEKNIKISVDVEDVKESESEYGAYNILNIKSVEIIG